ncbi:MAG: hypothetical protein EPN38_05685 [Rhodanobacteraceae bacterium]|nr:MAG: hypothetical protein EPN38_05685 [Rhodanobacteraceae bacterium]
MQRTSGSIRNPLLLACVLAAAAMFAAPTALARGGYHGHGHGSADVLGALVAGAVIGGVLVAASQQDRGYRSDAYYYPAPAYPAPQYYGGYPAPGYGGGYPAYGNGAYYGSGGYGYGGSVDVGVVYSGRRDGWRRGDDRYRRDRHGHYYPRYGH